MRFFAREPDRSRVAAFGDFCLHTAAWGLLRASSPARAHAILRRIGALFRPIESAAEAQHVARSVARRGTCLSRALAVAARIPAADVVIAVEPRAGAPLFAHAWVELNGVPIEPSEVAGQIIARLSSPLRAMRRT